MKAFIVVISLLILQCVIVSVADRGKVFIKKAEKRKSKKSKKSKKSDSSRNKWDRNKCDQGQHRPIDKTTWGSKDCKFLITTEKECKEAAELLRFDYAGNHRDYNSWGVENRPPGCFHDNRLGLADKLYFNDVKSTKKCKRPFSCICRSEQSCAKCPRNHRSDGGTNPDCIPCKSGEIANARGSKCSNPTAGIEHILERLDEQKEKTNDLSIKNSRLWQKEQIRLQHDKFMQRRKARDNREEKDACSAEREDGTIIFPAIEVENEIEDVEDTTCIDTNRDELLKSFCGFRMDLDKLFKIQNMDKDYKEAKTFWPNICCKERKDKTLEVCEDPTGKIKRENIIPFALSQGGDYSRHNLYVEVTDTIKNNGYLHKGMKKLLDSLSSVSRSKKETANQLVDKFFNEVSLCGPRIIDAPGKPENKLCELFVPYKHAMRNFYNLIEHLYFKPIDVQQSSSFLESMESSLRKRQLNSKQRLGKINNNMQQAIKTKPGQSKTKAEEMCKHVGHNFGPTELKQMKQTHCAGYNHLDLSSTDVKNVAIHYLKSDIAYDDKKMFSLKQSLRYEIDDASCPAAPLFTPKDISIQQVAMDTLGKEKEWVAVVNLNTKDDNGYLQSELPYCKSVDKDYLIGAKVEVKAYVDNAQCCVGVMDYNKCKHKCANSFTELKDKHHKHYSKNVVLTGTQYTVKSSHVSRRRRLLQSTLKGS